MLSNFNLTYLLPLAGLLIAYLITRQVIPVIGYDAKQKKLMEDQSSPRRIHTEPVSSMGGIAIFASMLITIAIISVWLEACSAYPCLVGALCMVFFIGLKDDLLVLSAKKKLFIQIAAPALIILGGGLYIEDFGGLFGINSLPVWIAVPFTIYVYVVIINAYNLIDGIDGLAGGIGVMVAIFLGGWFLSAGYITQAVIAFTLAGALIGFLVYNWQPASIFMGDTGSMVVGLTLAYLIVDMMRIDTAASGAPFGHVIPVVGMALIAVPLYDTIRVFILRIGQGRSPFHSGTDHVHHQLLALTGSHARVSVYLIAANVAILLFVLSFSQLPVTLLFFLSIALCLVILPTAGIKRRLLFKSGVFSLDHRPADGKSNGNGNGNGRILRLNGFTPVKLRLIEWEISPQYDYSDPAGSEGEGRGGVGE